jgi:hypothetical protein
VLVAHTCTHNHSRGRDHQEDRGSKPTRVNSSQDPISKKPITKIELVEWLKVTRSVAFAVFETHPESSKHGQLSLYFSPTPMLSVLCLHPCFY